MTTYDNCIEISIAHLNLLAPSCKASLSQLLVCVLVPNWFPGWPLRPFYGCISLPTFPFFIETSENFETIFSFSLSKFGLVIVELIMLASLSNLLTFTSTRLSVILIYNFSQIVERIWRKKLYNCVSISGHATVPKARRLFLDSLVLMKSLLSIYLSLWCHCPQAWARSTAKMVLQQKSVALNQQLPAVFWFGTGFLLTGRRKTLVQKKQCVDCLFKLNWYSGEFERNY